MLPGASLIRFRRIRLAAFDNTLQLGQGRKDGLSVGLTVASRATTGGFPAGTIRLICGIYRLRKFGAYQRSIANRHQNCDLAVSEDLGNSIYYSLGHLRFDSC